MALTVLTAGIIVLAAHWVADFLCQTDTMAQNKSHSLPWLSVHVLVYTVVLGVLTSVLTIWPGVDAPLLTVWIGVNGVAHLATDFWTSKWTASLYSRGDRHNFFVVVGLDQLIHGATLLFTLGLVL